MKMSSIYVIEITPTHTKGALQSRKKKPPPKKTLREVRGEGHKGEKLFDLGPPLPY